MLVSISTTAIFVIVQNNVTEAKQESVFGAFPKQAKYEDKYKSACHGC